VEYKLWKIDPEAPAASVVADTPAAAPDSPTRPQTHLAAPRSSPTAELISMAVIVGLVLGSLLTGMVIYKSGVVCRVAAPQSGLSVLSDGRDTGIRTHAQSEEGGSVQVRLRPGRHVLQLRGQGAPDQVREVEVQRGALCEASFAVSEPSR
jgi:hypothetical protein